MSGDDFFSQKGKRKVSSFFGRELLYDYLTGQLDPERIRSVEDYLRNSGEGQKELQLLRAGADYADVLSESKVSGEIEKNALTKKSHFQGLVQKLRFQDWPPLVKIGLEASVLALGVAVFSLIIPWNRLMDLKFGSTELVLSKVDHQQARKSGEEIELNTENISFPDEGVAMEVKKSPEPTALPSTTVRSEKPDPAARALVVNSKKVGFLYRGSVAANNVRAVTPRLVERIESLGARKAGQVDLGWPQGTGAYFHFTAPEAKYDEILAVFGDYGQLKMQKERHERVMPDGIIRVIINLDEKKN